MTRKYLHMALLGIAASSSIVSSGVRADSTVTIPNQGVLQASGPSPTGVVTNVLAVPGVAGVSFSFSGSLSDTNTFQQGGPGAPAGYDYDDYVLTVAPSTATAVTVSIDFSGTGLSISDLRTRWYNYAANGNSFLQGAAGTGVITGTTTVTGAAIESQITNISLTAGTYVFEIAGKLPAGVSNYAGVLGLAAPVPEAGTAPLMLTGVALLGLLALRRRSV